MLLFLLIVQVILSLFVLKIYFMDVVTNTNQKLILIVDDEQSIRDSLHQILIDEGYLTEFAQNGLVALEQIHKLKPDLVILDIWMPEMDGIETLKKIKSDYADLPVIMISGHATISTAVQATKMGAIDFVEKPLDLDTTLNSVKKALDLPRIKKKLKDFENIDNKKYEINSECFAKISNLARGKKFTQKTLKSSKILYGLGVHSGQKSGLVLEPLPKNSGIHFANVSNTQSVPAHLDYVGTTGFATTIKYKEAQVSTIEHLMSALNAYGITNLLIKCNGEVPVMDGSSQEFCTLIEEIGILEQDAEIYSIKVKENIKIDKGKEFIMIEPADSFIIDYTLQYPEPVGTQRLVFELSSPEKYKQHIAPARTFGFVKDISYLQQKGLAQGGRFDNFVLIGENGVINSELRFPDEQVRHKILDAIGDLYLLGRPLEGKITASMTGHSDNIELLRKVLMLIRS